ncbi:MAG: Uma2 family endonuclease [Gammaproteobacteria bacterium]|nr:Uma2 family endonuclease [Gammaproteobacteria bacterium]MDE2263007.1 Uma2 family endonuclease [Gammaproteobacteria bacterium]
MIAVYTPAAKPITIDLYQQMGEKGLLTREDRVQLIEGKILEMPPIGTRHGSVTGRLDRWLNRAVGDAAIVRLSGPVNLGKYSQPQPDLMLLQPRADDYVASHPGPEDVLLLVEVSDSTLEFDQGRKRALYAQFAVPEYWVIDVNSRSIQVYSGPADGEFRSAVEYRPQDTISPRAFPQVRTAVKELFVDPDQR